MLERVLMNMNIDQRGVEILKEFNWLLGSTDFDIMTGLTVERYSEGPLYLLNSCITL